MIDVIVLPKITYLVNHSESSFNQHTDSEKWNAGRAVKRIEQIVISLPVWFSLQND